MIPTETNGTSTGTIANFMQLMPSEYKQQGNCPHCGAPIYIDAKCFKGKKLVTLPQAFYTCTCRFTLQPQVIHVPYIVPAPAPAPNPFPPLQPSPWTEPQITWTVKAPSVTSPNICVQPTTAQPNTLDWKRFTETGGITQHPDLTKNIICVNAVSPVSMASGAMPGMQFGTAEL